jgi:hypothetical protein
VPHESAFSENRQDQDLLWKFNIPDKESRNTLLYLDQHNINAYSLFGSEDALMRTVAFRDFNE